MSISDLVADRFGLPRAPRISRAEAQCTLSPVQLVHERVAPALEPAHQKELKAHCVFRRLRTVSMPPGHGKERLMLYLEIKSLHILLVTSWFAGLLPAAHLRQFYGAGGQRRRARPFAAHGRQALPLHDADRLPALITGLAVARRRHFRAVDARQTIAGCRSAGYNHHCRKLLRAGSTTAATRAATSGSAGSTRFRLSCCSPSSCLVVLKPF